MSITATSTTLDEVFQHLWDNYLCSDGYTDDKGNIVRTDYPSFEDQVLNVKEALERHQSEWESLNLDSLSAEQVGETVVQEWTSRTAGGGWTWGPQAKTALADALIKSAKAVLAKPSADVELRASFPVGENATPDQRDNILQHATLVGQLQRWCNDGVDDIAGGVDAQVQQFIQSPRFDVDGGTCCMTFGHTKDWFGEVMKHKRFLLAQRPKVGTDETVEGTPEESPEVAELRRSAEVAKRQVNIMRSQFAAVFAALKNEAENRNWCSEYEDFLDTMEGNVPIDLDEYRRMQDFEVSWTETYTVTVERSRTVTARNADEAQEQANEESGDMDLYDMYHSGQADVTFEDTDDWNVE